MDWKILYDNLSEFNSDMGTVQDAPPFGVLAILYPDPTVGRSILHGADYYLYLDNKEWIGADWFGMIDHVLHGLVNRGCVKAGRAVTIDQFKTIRQRALADKDFPPKSAWHRDERPENPDITTHTVE